MVPDVRCHHCCRAVRPGDARSGGDDVNYADFLVSKAQLANAGGFEPNNLPGHPFADCGLIDSSYVKKGANPVRRLRGAGSAVPVADQTRSAVLLAVLPVGISSTRFLCPLRAMRFGVLPSIRGAGRWEDDQSVLLAPVLHGMASAQPEFADVPESGGESHSSPSGGCRSRTTPCIRRGRAPHRRGQAQLPPIKPCRIPRSVISPSVSPGRYAR